MRILLVADSYLPTLGGVERHVSTLSRYLRKQGLDVEILTDTPGGSNSGDFKEGININRTLGFKHRSNPLQWPFTFLYNSWKVKTGIEHYGRDFDVIHHHGSHVLYMDKINLKNKIVMTRHGILSACISFWGIDGWCGDEPSAFNCAKCMINIRKSYVPFFGGMYLYSSYFYSRMRKSLLQVKKVIAVSDFVGNVIYNAYELSNLITIYNFIDIYDDINLNLEISMEADGILNIPDRKKILLYSGRLDHQKGVHLLLEAFKKVTEENDDIHLVLTGGGELKDYVEILADKNENISYMGYISREQQIRLISECDVFVAPSVYPDACPTTILEAMALGKPVISTKVGGIPELVIEGKTGFLIEPNDSDQLASKIIFTFSKDLGSFKNHCLSRAKDFDINNVGKKILEVYSDIVYMK